MSRDLDLDAILAEFHGQEEKARPVKRAEPPKTPSRRELREEAERQNAAKQPAPSGDKTVLFEKLPAENAAPKPKAAVKAPAPAGEKRSRRSGAGSGGEAGKGARPEAGPKRAEARNGLCPDGFGAACSCGGPGGSDALEQSGRGGSKAPAASGDPHEPGRGPGSVFG